MTSIICKVMESIVRDELVKHMACKNLFSEFQHTFVPQRLFDKPSIMYGEMESVSGVWTCS